MSEPKNSTQWSTPLPLAPSSGRTHPRPLASPLTHYRELHSMSRRGRENAKVSFLSPILSESPAGPPERPGNEPHQPAHQANATAYTYNFAQDFATSDDRIESDATADCSDYDPSEAAENACRLPSLQLQVQPVPQRQRGDLKAQQAGTQNRTLKLNKVSQNIGNSRTHNLPSPTLDRESSERSHSTGYDKREATVDMTPPPGEFQNKTQESGLMEKGRSTARPLSLKLGTTPRSARQMDHDSLHVALTEADSDLEERDLPSLNPPSRDKRRYEIVPTPESEDDPFASPKPHLMFAGARRERPRDAIARHSRSTSAEEEDESEPQYSISDAILDMHELMGKPFWADEEWLATSGRVVARGPVYTPFSDEMIDKTTRLIEVVDRIKARRGKLEQARLASAMSHRINRLVQQISAACRTMWQHLFGNRQPESYQRIWVHEETMIRMREYVIPRLVLALSKTFTLLCNQISEMRRLVISVIEQLCFNAERIAKIIELGTERNDDDASGKVIEVEEFMDCLAVVRDWAKAEKQAGHNVKAKRYIAL